MANAILLALSATDGGAFSSKEEFNASLIQYIGPARYHIADDTSRMSELWLQYPNFIEQKGQQIAIKSNRNVHQDLAEKYAPFLIRFIQETCRIRSNSVVPFDSMETILNAGSLCLDLLLSLRPCLNCKPMTIEKMQYQLAKKYLAIGTSWGIRMASLHLLSINDQIWTRYHCSNKIQGKSLNSLAIERENVFNIDPIQILVAASNFPPAEKFDCLATAQIVMGIILAISCHIFESKCLDTIQEQLTNSGKSWLQNLSVLGDMKGFSNYSDRFFRLLWKCASEMEKQLKLGGALLARQHAIEFYCTCDTFDKAYAAQQIFRAGFQSAKLGEQQKKHTFDVIKFYDHSLQSVLKPFDAFQNIDCILHSLDLIEHCVALCLKQNLYEWSMNLVSQSQNHLFRGYQIENECGDKACSFFAWDLILSQFRVIVLLEYFNHHVHPRKNHVQRNDMPQRFQNKSASVEKYISSEIDLAYQNLQKILQQSAQVKQIMHKLLPSFQTKALRYVEKSRKLSSISTNIRWTELALQISSQVSRLLVTNHPSEQNAALITSQTRSIRGIVAPHIQQARSLSEIQAHEGEGKSLSCFDVNVLLQLQEWTKSQLDEVAQKELILLANDLKCLGALVYQNNAKKRGDAIKILQQACHLGNSIIVLIPPHQMSHENAIKLNLPGKLSLLSFYLRDMSDVTAAIASFERCFLTSMMIPSLSHLQKEIGAYTALRIKHSVEAGFSEFLQSLNKDGGFLIFDEIAMTIYEKSNYLLFLLRRRNAPTSDQKLCEACLALEEIVCSNIGLSERRLRYALLARKRAFYILFSRQEFDTYMKYLNDAFDAVGKVRNDGELKDELVDVLCVTWEGIVALEIVVGQNNLAVSRCDGGEILDDERVVGMIKDSLKKWNDWLESHEHRKMIRNSVKKNIDMALQALRSAAKLLCLQEIEADILDIHSKYCRAFSLNKEASQLISAQKVLRLKTKFEPLEGDLMSSTHISDIENPDDLALYEANAYRILEEDYENRQSIHLLEMCIEERQNMLEKNRNMVLMIDQIEAHVTLSEKRYFFGSRENEIFAEDEKALRVCQQLVAHHGKGLYYEYEEYALSYPPGILDRKPANDTNFGDPSKNPVQSLKTSMVSAKEDSRLCFQIWEYQSWPIFMALLKSLEKSCENHRLIGSFPKSLSYCFAALGLVERVNLTLCKRQWISLLCRLRMEMNHWSFANEALRYCQNLGEMSDYNNCNEYIVQDIKEWVLTGMILRRKSCTHQAFEALQTSKNLMIKLLVGCEDEKKEQPISLQRFPLQMKKMGIEIWTLFSRTHVDLFDELSHSDQANSEYIQKAQQYLLSAAAVHSLPFSAPVFLELGHLSFSYLDKSLRDSDEEERYLMNAIQQAQKYYLFKTLKDAMRLLSTICHAKNQFQRGAYWCDSSINIHFHSAMLKRRQNFFTGPLKDEMEHLSLDSSSLFDKKKYFPKDWLICSFVTNMAGDLMIRRSKTDAPEIFVILSPKSVLTWQIVMHDFERILDESKETLKHSKNETTAKQKKDWWDTRENLDRQLLTCIEKMETEVLGGWRCLLSNDIQNPFSSIQMKELTAFILQSMGVPTSEYHKSFFMVEEILRILVCSKDELDDDEMEQILTYVTTIRPSSSSMRIPDVIKALRLQLDQMQLSQKLVSPASSQAIDMTGDVEIIHNILPTLSTESIKSMKVKDLKHELKTRGLTISGLKQELQKRLLSAVAKIQTDHIEEESQKQQQQQSKECPSSFTFLILDEKLHKFPWEGMSCFTKNQQSVSRIPSISFLEQYAGKDLGEHAVDIHQVHYVLNPEGDLKSTERRLSPVFHALEEKYGWNGVISRRPDEEEMTQYLTQMDLFIYAGHGNGEKYLRRKQIEALYPHCAASFLIGCSSGDLNHDGFDHLMGVPYSYLLGGSSTVLGMLWDVTDKDIDRFSTTLFESWFSSNEAPKPIDVGAIIPIARGSCKLKSLNGLAAVVYGLPLFLKSQGGDDCTSTTIAAGEMYLQMAT